MSQGIEIQYGGSPDGLRTIGGLHPPLTSERVQVVESAITDHLSEGYNGQFLGATAIIMRRPDVGEEYSEFQMEPLQLHDSRAEHVGNKMIPGLLARIAEALEEDGARVRLSRQQQYLNPSACLFGGEMKIWWEEGQEKMIPVKNLIQ